MKRAARHTLHTKNLSLFTPRNNRVVNSFLRNSHQVIKSSVLKKRKGLFNKGYKQDSTFLHHNFFNFFSTQNISHSAIIPSMQIAASVGIVKLSWLSALISGFATTVGFKVYSDSNLKKTKSKKNQEKVKESEIVVEVVTPARVMTYEEKIKKAQQIKARIDTLLLACLDSDHWDKNITFAETVDLCLAVIEGNENLIDEYRQIFFVNEPESWRKFSAKEVIKLLLEVRDKNSTKEIGAMLNDLFYLLPVKLQESYPVLAFNLPCRLWRGHPKTKPQYVLKEDIFNKKEEELR